MALTGLLSALFLQTSPNLLNNHFIFNLVRYWARFFMAILPEIIIRLFIRIKVINRFLLDFVDILTVILLKNTLYHYVILLNILASELYFGTWWIVFKFLY